MRDRAAALGFTLFGIAPATDADGFGRFCDWLDKGYAGEMDYLHEHREERRHPASVVDSVRSVVMLGLEYQPGDRRQEAGDARDGRVAKYARGPARQLTQLARQFDPPHRA